MTDSLPREDATVGTICEYLQDDARPWVIVVREPQSIREYDDTLGGRSIPDGWDEFDAETTDVIRFVPLDGKDDVIARLEGADLAGHREVATDLVTSEDVIPLVGALPHFNVLGPTEQASPAKTTPEDRHVE